jgi:superfamily I DNA/RNA helicase
MRIYVELEDNSAIAEIAFRHSIPIFMNEIEHAKELVKYCDKSIYDMIDYIDMIYITATKAIKLAKYDFIFIDEAQDLSKAMQLTVKKMMLNNTRVTYVGDPKQAIYSFAGSDSNSFYNLGKVIGRNVCELPLSVSYRCPKKVVKEAQKIVPYIEYHENAIQGIVRDGTMEDICGDATVVCRNTKPLVQLFFDLLKQNVKANIKGKEFGESIIKMIEKTRKSSQTEVLKHLEIDRLKLKKKLIDRGIRKPDNHQSMIDFLEKKDIINIMFSNTNSIQALKKNIHNIFVDKKQQGLMLMTIHKSKGLEDNKIILLNPELIPSKFAVTDEEMEQENNLKYVAITRAKKELLYISNFGT